MTVVGFTGGRSEPTDAQLRWLITRLRELRPTALHHGACVGADAAVHRVARILMIPTHVHPPTNTTHVDSHSVSTADVLYPPTPYLVRNHDVVDACDWLLALPDRPETLRSGTWATVRYARRTIPLERIQVRGR